MTIVDERVAQRQASNAAPRDDAGRAAGPAGLGVGPTCALPLGTEMAGYRLVRVIGHGGFGIVYEAVELASGARVAVKEYMPVQLAARPAGQIVLPWADGASDAYELGRRSFLEEAALLGRYRHPGLVHALASWEQNGTAYMAMPYYEGATIEQIIERDRRTIDEAWLKSMLGPILAALERLHGDRCYHRDVSPDNILVPDAGGAVLLDLGAARRVIGQHARALTVMLKSGFAPIEQYADDPAFMPGPWSDIYALCGVLYYAITGGTRPPASASRMMRDNLVPLAQSSPDGYSAEFLAAIDAGLALRPEQRPRTIAAFRQQLFAAPGSLRSADEATVDEAAAPATGVAAGGRPADGASPRARGARTAISAALVVFVIGGWWLGRGDVANAPSTARPEASSVVAGGTAAPGAVPRDPASEPRLPPASSAAPGASATPSPGRVDAGGGPAEATARASVPPGAVPIPSPLTAPSPTAPSPTPAMPAKTAPDAPVATGRLSLSVYPWAEVYVDGQRKGVSPPLSTLTLPAGRHRVELRNPGAASARLTVDVPAGRSATIQHRFP